MKTSTIIIIGLVGGLTLLALGILAPQRRQISELKEELRRQKEYQAQLEHEIRRIGSDIDKLRANDPAMIENVARNKFGYCRPGEVPYTVETTKTPEDAKK